jgi:hypothetical protein
VAQRERAEDEHVERSVAQWGRRAADQRATTAALDELGAGWSVLHDVTWPGRPQAGIDHVVTGPPGVFLVATEAWTGAVRLDSGVLLQNGVAQVGATVGVTTAAYAVAKLIGTTVQPVLCLTERRVAGRAGDVVVCSTHGLVPMLLSRPTVLSGADLEALTAQVRCRLASASALPVGAERRSLWGLGSRRRTSTV